MIEEGTQDSEIIRIEIAKMASALTSRQISIETDFVHNNYGCETWTISNQMHKRIEAFELLAYGRVLKYHKWKHWDELHVS